jgi:hypothetical protein
VDFSDRLVNVGYGACALMVLGTLAPWAVSGPVTSSGVDDQYGLYMLLLAAFSGFVLWRWTEFAQQEFLVGLTILAGICLIYASYVAWQLEDLRDLTGAEIGWGLIVTIAGSVALLTVTALLYRR